MGDRIEHWGATVLLAILIVASFGCASLTAPESPAQGLAYADAQFTALVDTAADLREQGVIDEATADKISPLIYQASEALDLAWLALDQGRPETVADYVATVNRLLVELSRYIEEARDVDG